MKRYGSLAWKSVKVGTVLGLICMTFLFQPKQISAQQNMETSVETFKEDTLSSWFEHGQKMRAIIHRVYVCGEEIVELDHLLSYDDVIVLATQHPEWRLSVDQAHTIIRFEEQVNDLSPHCKVHAFFGIDDEGLFSLYDGKPAEDNVMKTFFQLNIPYLESKLPKQEFEHLQMGIRVRDIEEYDSVLATYNEFRLDRLSQ